MLDYRIGAVNYYPARIVKEITTKISKLIYKKNYSYGNEKKASPKSSPKERTFKMQLLPTPRLQFPTSPYGILTNFGEIKFYKYFIPPE